MEEVTLEIQERLSIGFALGWSFFGATEQFPYDELVIYLGIVSLNFKWINNDR
tara:strand:- start:10196 stop:10354 length:159 start_codon:yes stop_codon:yes gene_type:complete